MYEKLLDRLLNAEPGDVIEDQEGETYRVLLAKNGCRFVRLTKDSVLMEQNIHKDSKFAEMARRGAKIGWIIGREGIWKLVMAGEKKPKR